MNESLELRIIKLLETHEKMFIHCPSCGSRNNLCHIPAIGYVCLNIECKMIGQTFNLKFDEVNP
jgi:transcription elongation factor Elf1